MSAPVRRPRIVGESRARELILLGAVVAAAEALRIGLANRVVADEDLDAAADGLARRLARRSRAFDGSLTLPHQLRFHTPGPRPG